MRSHSKLFNELSNMLVGLPLNLMCNICEMGTFDFGRNNRVITKSGFIFTSDLALHVQCPWQITVGGEVFLGSGDSRRKNWRDGRAVLAKTSSGEDVEQDLQWFKRESYHSSLEPKFVVVKVEMATVGCLRVTFSRNACLTVLSDCSAGYDEVEMWRLFETAGQGRHLVYTSNGFARKTKRDPE